jgi:hypothetical protein
MILGIPAMQPLPGEGLPTHNGSLMSDPANDAVTAEQKQAGGGESSYTSQDSPEQPVDNQQLQQPQMYENNNTMNGGRMPPQQVYVNGGSGVQESHHMMGPVMTGIETQFQSLGFQPEAGGKPHAGESDTAEEDNDETETEEDPVKLFVGQVRMSK